MKRNILRSPSHLALTGSVLGLALLGLITFTSSVSAWWKFTNQPALATKNPEEPQVPSEAISSISNRTATAPPTKELIGSEVISISRFGFETTELTRPAGKFFLLVENRSGINPITFRLTSDRGEKVIEVTQPLDQLDWAGEVNPRPGHYTLTIAERPSWKCDITIIRS